METSHRCSPLLHWSGFELFILEYYEDFGADLFHHIEPASLVRLAQTSTRMRSVIQLYTYGAWDYAAFCRNYWKHATAVSIIIEAQRALFFGPSVLHFLNRSQGPLPPLDLCISRASLTVFENFLHLEDYKLQHQYSNISDLQSSIELHNEEMAKLLRSQPHLGLRSRAAIFLYTRDELIDTVTSPMSVVNVHVVEKDPFAYVLALPASKLTPYINASRLTTAAAMINFMTGKHAVSVFPVNTFINKRSLKCRGLVSRPPRERIWLEGFKKSFLKYDLSEHKMKIYANPDPQETGERQLGDGKCWILPLFPPESKSRSFKKEELIR